jgi:hypothetical protein
MITIATKYQKQKVKSWHKNYLDEKHTEMIEKTTVYFLFIPVYQRRKVIKSGL